MKTLKYILLLLLMPGLLLAADPVPDEKNHKLQYKFSGAWLPDFDPALMGPENFRTLTNMRYTDGSIEGVQGYSKINTTALTTYIKPRSGIQLRTDRDVGSYFLIHAENTGLTASQVFQNQTAIPDQGDFEATALHTDASGAGLGRFSAAPDGSIAYTNGKEAYIWSGEEMRVGGFFTCDDSSGTNPKDKTVAVNNTLTDAANLATVNATQLYSMVLSVRPLQGIKCVPESPNTSAATLTVYTYDGSSFTECSNVVDGTSTFGRTLNRTGTVTFDSTLGTSKPYHFEGMYLYAYLIELSGGSATISHVSLDAPWQPILDVWDGVARQPILFQMSYSSAYEDYTLAVNESSVVDYPVGGILDQLDTTDHVLIMFEEKTAAIRFQVLGSMVNTNATNAVIKYWDGDSYETVGTVTDTTKTGTKSLGQTGLMSWNPPSGEEPRTLFGVTGYIYQLTFSAQLSGTHGDATEEILVDIVTGVPAQATVYPFDFPSIYKNRLLLCSFSEGKEGNRVDFSVTNAPNTWNGVESSMDGLQSLYFGGVEPLTTGTQLYNRYGSSIFTAWVAFKKSEIYMLTGDSPEDFKIYPISLTVGCPAPLTVATCEVGFEIAKDARRNLIVWLSFSGPYAFDGAVLYPLSGINKYFDPNESACINQDAIENARGWFDQAFREYNLLIPSGSGQTTNNLWLAYDLIRKKWYRKDPGSAEMPQTAFPVVDDDGAQYIYAGIDTGYVMRLENGNNWDGTNITQEVITGDFWPTKSIWDKTLIRYFKIMAQRIDESHTLEVKYYADSDEDNGVDVVWQDGDVAFADGDVEWAGASVATLDLSLATGTERLVRTTSILNSLGWSHAFGFEVNTSDTTKGFRPVAWGIKYQYVRDDE